MCAEQSPNGEGKKPDTQRNVLNSNFRPAIHRLMSFKPESRAALAKASREEAARLLKEFILPRGADETIKACIARAAKRLGWPVTRTQDIWRKDAARIDAFEMDQLRRVVATKSMAKNEECGANGESGA